VYQMDVDSPTPPSHFPVGWVRIRVYPMGVDSPTTPPRSIRPREPRAVHASPGLAGPDGPADLPDSVYAAIWRILEDEAERRERKASA
jgi:hypothetical protein